MNLGAYREGSLVAVNLALGHGCTTRYAEVSFLSQYGDALCLVDCDGRELTGAIVSIRSMTPDEVEQWESYPRLCAYEAAYRAADPAVMARVVLVLLAAARGRVVETTGETVREVA